MQKQRLSTVRNLNPRIFKKLKAKAAEENLSVGAALNKAMEEWVAKEDKGKKDPAGLLKIKPFDWGEGTENLSTEIDSVLYG